MRAVKPAFFALVASVYLSGCTSMQTVEQSPEFIQSEIAQGRILTQGIEAIVYTNKGKKFAFMVTDVSNGHITGETEDDKRIVRIAIDEIIAVQSEQISVGKTSMFAGSALAVSAVASTASAVSAIIP